MGSLVSRLDSGRAILEEPATWNFPLVLRWCLGSVKRGAGGMEIHPEWQGEIFHGGEIHANFADHTVRR